MSTAYSPFAPPSRPLSAGPRASTSNSSNSPSSSALPLPSSSAHPAMTSPGLVRPSGYNTRMESIVGQTRLRARSVGKGAAPPLPHPSPTIPGNPVMSVEPLVTRQSEDVGGSPLRRVQTDRERKRYGSDEEGDDVFPLSSSAEGTEEGSIQSDDSPPLSPRDGSVPSFAVVPPSRRGSRTVTPEERENWLRGGEVEDSAREVTTRSRAKSLEGKTRMSLRRGKSFTSLLPGEATPAPLSTRWEPPRGPPSPVYELQEPPTPIASFQPASDIESGQRQHSSISMYPPATAASLSTDLPAAPRKSLRDFVPQLAILISLFLCSFAVIAFTISTLPGLFLPHSVSDLPSLTAAMTTYRASSFFAEVHLFTVLTVLFLWKQCFSIPGSILTNILFGALYGTWMGSAWACLWTATGSTGAYLIAVVIAPLVEYYFATPLAVTRRTLKLPTPEAAESTTSTAGVAPLTSGDLFSHLMLARLFPLLPYSVLNVVSGVLRIPLSPFFITLLLGSFPFNFATVSIGELVALAAADPSTPLTDKIWSKEVLLKLVAVTVVSVIPVVFKELLKRLIANSTATGGAIDRLKGALSRSLFGFGALPHAATTTHHAHTASTSSGGPRAWRRKLSRSIGGAGEFLQLTAGAAAAGLTGRKGYERVGSMAAMGQSERDERHELSEGVEQAEMGGREGTV